MRHRRAVAGLVLALGAVVAGCRRHPADGPGPILGAPIEEGAREGATTAALEGLPELIRASLPAVIPRLCLDRGIRARPGGVYVAEHRRSWLERLERRGTIVGTSNRSAAHCPARSFWVSIASLQRRRGDTLAVPLAYEYVQRVGEARIDPVTTTIVVVPAGSGWKALSLRP